MFADTTPVEGLSLASAVPWWAWAVLGLVLLAAAWWLTRHGLSAGVGARVRGLLVMRGRPGAGGPEEPGPTPDAPAAGADSAPAAPAAPQRGAGAAPAEQAAAHGAAPAPPMVWHGAAEGEAPAWLPRALVVIASVPTLLALPWAAYAVAQHLPVPLVVALPLGILFDVAMVGAVLVALLVPSVSRQASALGWVAASAAAVAIAAHTGVGGALVFAATPLISKALWGLLVIIRRQQAAQRAAHAAAQQQREQEEDAAREAAEAAEAAAAAAQAERDAELSDDLTHAQRVEIAQTRRQARYRLDMAAAERELERAESEAEHQKALAEIRRLGEQQRAEDAEAAAVFEQRLRLERQLSTLQGEAPAFLSRSSEEVAGEIAAPTAAAGFGGAAPQAFGFQRPLDVRALTPEGAKVKFEDLPENHQALVKYVATAKEPTMREAGRRLNKDGRTIGRWVEKLTELGYDLPFDRHK